MVNASLVSMTGFATQRGEAPGWDWVWEIRSVNGRGLDLRLRLPEGVEGLEAQVRQAVAAVAARGNITVSLKLARRGVAGAGRLDPEVLAGVVAALAQAEAAAAAAGLALRPSSAAEILAVKGVMDAAGVEPEGADLAARLAQDLPALTQAFQAMRRDEGRALAAILAGQIDRVAALVAEARAEAAARAGEAGTRLHDALARILAEANGFDEARVAQELALMAVKADVTEELDRLDAHVAAARRLLAEAGPAGRKFDFLTQEFNREANTLCSKSGSEALTRIGLDLKHVIDQMREQVQNVE